VAAEEKMCEQADFSDEETRVYGCAANLMKDLEFSNDQASRGAT